MAAKLSNERFAMMSEPYEDEQAQLCKGISELQAEIAEQERQTENLELFIKRAQKLRDLQNLHLMPCGNLLRRFTLKSLINLVARRNRK